MSVPALTWVLEHSDTTGTDRLVLMLLAWHANDASETWTAGRKLAREARVARSTVQRALARLTAANAIRLLEAGDNRRSARYHVVMERASEARPGSASEARPRVGQNYRNYRNDREHENVRVQLELLDDGQPSAWLVAAARAREEAVPMPAGFRDQITRRRVKKAEES